MLKFLRKYWIDLCFFDVSLDLEDSIAIDVLNIMAGSNNGIKFRGSFLMLYWETSLPHDPKESSFNWDLFYIRQWTKG